MTDAKPPAAGPAQPQAAPGQPDGGDETPAPDRGERFGTILMVVACTGLAVLVLDVALKGKLLAPLFALLPAPKSSTVPEESGDGGLPDAAG